MWMLMKIFVGSLKRIKGGVAKKQQYSLKCIAKNIQIETEYKY